MFDSVESARDYVRQKWKRFETELPNKPFNDPAALLSVEKARKRPVSVRPIKPPRITYPLPDYDACYVCNRKLGDFCSWSPCCSARCHELTRIKPGKASWRTRGKYKNGLQKPCMVCQEIIPYHRIRQYAFYCSAKCGTKAAYARTAYARHLKRLAENE